MDAVWTVNARYISETGYRLWHGRTKNGDATPISSNECASADSDSSAPATTKRT